MNAENIAKALNGRREGRVWRALCPAHNDHSPSLVIQDSENGKVLVKCWAGCGQDAVIRALSELGLWPNKGQLQRPISTVRATTKPEHSSDDTKRAAQASAIWEKSQPLAGTLAETYLLGRGIRLPAATSLRFHRGLIHSPSGCQWPAMVALVTRGTDAIPQGITRTFLARNGAGKAPVENARMMLGPIRGGVVRLAEPTDVLMIGEGIETTLSAMQASGKPGWAALSTSTMKLLDLPDGVRDVIILADADGAGEEAARSCALRWIREGRRVRIARPPPGMDFNDMLTYGVHQYGWSNPS
jgi:putative DNA primase/helicase